MSAPFVSPTCLDCAGDSTMVAIYKITNNLANLFVLMSSGSFTPKFVALVGSGCGCSTDQMLAAMNNNIAGFFEWWVANGGGSGGFTGVDKSITSWSDLAAVVTATQTVPQIKVWVETGTGVTHVTQLRAGTTATDTASGIQRPGDYDAGTNAKVWYDMLS